MKALSIVASALFTLATAQSLGLLLLQRLRPNLTRQEQYLYGFGAGAALLSLLVFAINAASVASAATFVIVGLASVAACAYWRAYVPFPAKAEPLPWVYKGLTAITTPAFLSLYFAHALAPEASPDGSSYHLGLVQTFLDQHGFGRITTDMYANMPLGMEMLFQFAFSLGRHSAAALVHLCFLFLLPVLMITIARRFGFTQAGVTAALLIFISPLFGMDGSTAYIDVALAYVVVALFGALQTWDETRDDTLLPLIGLFAGFAYTVKLTAFVALPYALAFVVYKTLRRRASVVRPILLVGACAAMMILPWLVKNAVTVANPFSPFLNRLFPNPYIRISAEESYREYLQRYDGLQSYWDIPVELTLRGAVLNGLFGPVFLLAPLGLLALRWKFGRQVLLAALVFAATYPTNIGSRFLMSAAPFIAFAMALPISQSRAMAPLLILAHAFASLPANTALYAQSYAWRIEEYVWDAALRRQPEWQYLNDYLPGYAAARLAEQHVPKDGTIYTAGGIAQAYCRRRVIVGYQSAQGNRISEYIATAVTPAFQPNGWWTYTFPPRTVQKLRLVRTGQPSSDIWTIHEMRLFDSKGEIERKPDWRLSAQPAPWDVQLAFDNCPVTRWFSAESAKPGMYVEVTLPQPAQLTSVRVEGSLDPAQAKARLEFEAEGKWQLLSPEPEISPAIPLGGLRREAVQDMKREGITHFSVEKTDYYADDIAADAARWGLTLLGETESTRLYRLD